MTKAINNYDKTKISMAHVFLQYDQATMIHKYSLDYNSDWLYITFINRTYRINRKTGSVQWSDNDFETVHEANHNEAMTIYDVLCYSKDRCHLSHEFVNINSLSSVRTGNLSPNRGFFQNTADFFNGKTVELRNACISLSGKELEKGDVAFKLNLFPFLPIIIRFWEADDEFPASLQILADRNTLDYMHYETLMFTLTHLFSRLKEEMRIEKGEESRQRLIECAAELFWKNGYSATGISEILKQTDLPKGSFYFYFKSKDDLATAVTEYYQKILLEQFQNSSQGNDWESFIEEIFDFLSERTNGQTFAGCPYAVMGMETALSKPAVASVFMEGLKKFEQIFQEVLLCSGLSPDHAKILSQRMLSIYQGYFLLGRISDDTSYLKNAKKNMIEMYREYRAFHGI